MRFGSDYMIFGPKTRNIYIRNLRFNGLMRRWDILLAVVVYLIWETTVQSFAQNSLLLPLDCNPNGLNEERNTGQQYYKR